MDISEIKTLDNFIDWYCNTKGFGSMNKNDFEVFIFHWLIDNHTECNGKSDFIICKFLKIPESKVRRLRYEAMLKYSSKMNYKEDLLNAMRNAKCQDGPKDGKISFAISNRILREYLSDLLMENGRFFDSSFNTSIVTLSAGDFVYILDELVINKEDDKQRIIDAAKKQIAKEKKFPTSLPEILKESGVLLGKVFLEKLVGSSADKIVDTIIDLVNEKNK